MFKKIASAAALVCLSTVAANAQTSPINQNLNVAVTIQPQCTVLNVGAGLNFASVGALTAQQDVDYNLAVACSVGTVYTVEIGTGLNAAATNDRKMASGANLLPYGLYRDAGRTQNFGLAAATEAVSGTMGALGVANIPVYARLPVPGTAPATGTYTDTVVVSLSF